MDAADDGSERYLCEDADFWSDIRNRIADAPLLPYDRLETAPRAKRMVVDLADKLLTAGWVLGGHTMSLDAERLNFNAHNRSFAFHVHAWDPLSFLLPAWQISNDIEYYEASRQYAFDWIDQYQKIYLDRNLSDARRTAIASCSPEKQCMAWYDMAVGQRVARLAYLLDVGARNLTYLSQKEFILAFRSVIFHLDVLDLDSFFVSHTNHGLYQALGQAAAARRFAHLPGFSRHTIKANDRLRLMFDRSYFSSGAHREHSPGYHHMVTASLEGACEAGLLDEDCNEMLLSAKSHLHWMITPEGALASIGDTDLRAGQFTHRGKLDINRLPVGIHSIPDAGYAFVRASSPSNHSADASYLAQMAGFHSRTHKHADHFGFIWSDLGTEILIDPGRFAYAGKTLSGSNLHQEGFWYSDPRRMYVETTRSHNCLEIDGRDYPRARTKPFGSALKSASQQDALFVTECEAVHFRAVKHWRGLIFLPRKFLIVLDWCRDASNTLHDFRQWFQFSEHWSLERTPGGFAGAHASSELCIHVADLLRGGTWSDVISGQIEPRYQGWRSDQADSLIPSPSICVERLKSHTVAFATIFSLGRFLVVDHSKCVVNASLTKGRLSWQSEDGDATLAFDRTSGLMAASLTYAPPAT